MIIQRIAIFAGTALPLIITAAICAVPLLSWWYGR